MELEVLRMDNINSRKLRIIIVFIIIILLIFGSILLGNTVSVQSAMTEVEKDTPYRLVEMREGNKKVIESGRIGNFFTCLNSFRSISTKNPLKGKSKDYRLYITKHKYFEISSVQNEVYLMSITENDLTGNRLYKTEVKAVNCSLKMLDRIKEVGDSRLIYEIYDGQPIKVDKF